MEKSFPTLYTKDSKGSVRIWNISIKNLGSYSDIICSYGLEMGKQTVTHREIKDGKNKGKTNETTHFEQACLEGESKYKDKMKGGDYTESISTSTSSISSTKSYLPMLAQEYKKHSSKIKFPCYIQPKLDGYRGLYYSDKLFSRRAQEFKFLDHILSEIKEKEKYILDGELYNHGELTFQELGILKKKSLKENDKSILEKIKYYVYDIVDESLTFEQRLNILTKLKEMNIPNVVIVNTYTCNSVKDIEDYHTLFLDKGYEGSIIRNKDSKYELNKRSYNLQKYKNFDDSEFEIVGYTKENEGMVVWICVTPEGKEFRVQSKGTKEERKELYMRGKEYLHKKLSVQYFGLTNDGIPRFPKTFRKGEDSIREDID
jgi:ATP-dependent DNA ligase